LRTIIINRLATTLRHCGAPTLLLASAAVGASDAHEYVVNVDANLEQMRIEAHFATPVNDVSARSGAASRFLDDARDCDSNEALANRGRRFSIPRRGISCISYSVDLQQAAAAERRNDTLSPQNIVVSPAVWLWHPPINSRSRIIVQFVLEGDTVASVPWPPIDSHDHSYEVVSSPRNAKAMAAFGRFIYSEEQIPGTRLRIALLRPRGEIDSATIIDWVRDTAGNVGLAYGRFPNPSPHIVVLPVGRSGWQGDSPVPFGRVLRDGGDSVELFIDERRPIEDFYDDWTATHEFSHLMLPFVRSPHRWISEGFAQYYQNVLLTRAGQYDERRAWQKLYEGFERGRKSRPELSPNEAAERGVEAATMKIYWSGAIIALLADVELRQRSDGRESLDFALDRLQRCCLPAATSWSGTQLFEKLDSFVTQPVFMPLYDQYADTRGFPDIVPIFERLGVEVANDRVSLRDDAELTEIRRAITEIYSAASKE